MDEKEIKSLFIVLSIIAFIVAIVIIGLFILFQRKKNKLLLKQRETEQYFSNEIAKAKIEIREETFRNISWELHDNIGQLLTLAKIQLQNTSNKKDVIVTLDKALKELRTLSKSINLDALKNMTLKEAVSIELERLNRLNFLEANLNIFGNEYHIKQDIEIVFFRILQEFFSNTIKHAKASKLNVNFYFNEKSLYILAEDNGVGFDKDEKDNFGIGLININKRAELINGSAIIISEPNKGTKLHLSYPKSSENEKI